ncbi:MAG: DUF1553 domain-containing protein [Planctomycetaceae bacterium]|nr:DUF1553 domain-containing protein [Planctomycetaceae bacterium]
MRRLLSLYAVALLCAGGPRAWAEAPDSPLFSRHVVAVFSKLGCNAGTCHGAVQGKGGLRLSLFGAQPLADHAALVREHGGRRIDLLEVDRSLLLLKATAKVPHGGGKRTSAGSLEYDILRNWIAATAPADDIEKSRLTKLEVTPREQEAKSGASYPLKVQATFADGTSEDVTPLATFSSLDAGVASVDAAGQVAAQGVGDAAIIVRFRAEPVMSQVIVAREGSPSVAAPEPQNFIDEHILAKLRRLNIPPSELADDATFLRRARLDVTGQLPTPDEVRKFLADADPQKRTKKIDQLLSEPGYAALWTLKFCDLLNASDFGVYADGLAEHFEAPRFQAWIRARLAENTPYDELAARILTATSRDGRSLEDWAKEVVALQEGYTSPRTDLEIYARRQTLDAYWQRKEAVGVHGALQIAHSFLGLRLECAQCHRHPHDVWQQDDLLSFANFFMGVRTVGFQGENEKRYPEEHALFKQYEGEGKKLTEEAKQLKEGKGKELAEKAKTARDEANRLKNEIRRDEEKPETQAAAAEKRTQLASLEQTIAEHDAVQKEIREKEQRGRMLSDDVPKRILHAQILHRLRDDKSKRQASVTSPLGTQSSDKFRLLGESQPLEMAEGEDPRRKVIEWLRRPDNPLFARAIVNRVWAHYFGRGIVDPPDDLSPYNPATHPEMLDELCQRFIDNRYDLLWLHRTILTSRTYQQTSIASAESEMDRANYAFFYPRRLPAEVLLDALDQATLTREDLDMQYYHWPKGMRTVEVPYLPRNNFIVFMLEQFGRPPRNSSAQCDCARQVDSSLLQVLSFANHPRVREKIADPGGRVAQLIKENQDAPERIRELYLATLGRVPDDAELAACQQYVGEAASPEEGLRGVLWSLLNTKEFVLQH